MFIIGSDEEVPNQTDVLEQRYPRITEAEAESITEAAYVRIEELTQQDFERAEQFQLGDMANVAVYLVRTTVEEEVKDVEYVEATDIEERIDELGPVSLLVLKRFVFSGND